jgi:phosphoinositide-3-kinase, regulatory subunit 4
MIAVDPLQRPTFDSLLHNARGTVFPETFYSFLHNYVASINELSTPSPFSFSNQSHPSITAGTPITATPTTTKPAISNTTHPALSADGDRLNDPLPSDSDHRLERLWSDYESVEPYLLPTAENESLEDMIKDPINIEFATPNVAGKPLQVYTAQLLTSVICMLMYIR